MELKGRIALITGAAVRLGRAITLALAGAGCHVFIHYGRSHTAAQQTQAEAQALGVQAAIHPADLTDPAAVQGIMDTAVHRFGRVDILVNNAALFLPGDLATTTLDDWQAQFKVNLRAPFLLCQAFARQIPPDGFGQIINVTDARVFRPAGDHLAYRLTKAALVTLTESLARDLAPRITVNAVALGAILPPPGEDETFLHHLAQTRIPLRRPGSLAAVTRNVLHLLEQEFLTGVVVRVDGGEYL